MASMSLSSRAVASRTTPAGFPPSGSLEKAVYRSTSGGVFVVMLVATRGGAVAVPGRGWRRRWAPAAVEAVQTSFFEQGAGLVRVVSRLYLSTGWSSRS